MAGIATQRIVSHIDGTDFHGDLYEMLSLREAIELTAGKAAIHYVLQVVTGQTPFNVHIWSIERQGAPVRIQDDDPASCVALLVFSTYTILWSDLIPHTLSFSKGG